MKNQVDPSLRADRYWTAMASAACAILFVVLLFLAAVQYRWIAELREGERRQLELSLKAAATRFADDFVSELLRVATAFQLEHRSRAESLLEQLKDAHEQWVGSAPHPDVIRQLLVVRHEGTELKTYRFDASSGSAQPTEWPASLSLLRRELSFQYARTLMAAYPKNPIFLEAIPALAVPFVVTEKPPGAGRRGVPLERKDVLGWSVAELDRNIIVRELLPALFVLHFGANDPAPYRVAIASTDAPQRAIYQSEPMSVEDLRSADLVLDLFAESDGQLRIGGPQTIRIDVPETPQWQLFVKHRTGSLDAAVEDLRRRNLAVGGAILLVLAASAVLVLMAAGRARTLARLQVEFAAAVSHELRTPLATIRAAAYNIEEGIAESPSQVQQYARVVQDAGRRLSTMVEQILLFADTQSWRRKMAFSSVNVRDVIERALESVSTVLSLNERLIEKTLPPELPQVFADPVLLRHCVENLVINALNYGEASPSRPVRIWADVDGKAQEVRIRVEDEGRGIDSVDLPHIFKPFYRGRNADLNARGTGLGLALVQRLMHIQRGHVSVQTAPQVGTTFTLHIPVAP